MSNRLRVSKHRRIKIENAIEKLIDMLDRAEPDPDFEPSLGSVEWMGWSSELAWAGGRGWNAGDDLEFDGETRPSTDDEPSLGASPCRNQIHWAQGNRDDRELEDEREPDAGL